MIDKPSSCQRSEFGSQRRHIERSLANRNLAEVHLCTIYSEQPTWRGIHSWLVGFSRRRTVVREFVNGVLSGQLATASRHVTKSPVLHVEALKTTARNTRRGGFVLRFLQRAESISQPNCYYESDDLLVNVAPDPIRGFHEDGPGVFKSTDHIPKPMACLDRLIESLEITGAGYLASSADGTPEAPVLFTGIYDGSRVRGSPEVCQ